MPSFKILNSDQIPYPDHAGRLFNVTGGQANSQGVQRIVPFLGAGVSLSGRQTAPHPTLTSPNSLNFDSILKQSGFEGRAKVFLEMALLLATVMQAWEEQEHEEPIDGDLLTRLQEDVYPPSAGELAKLFSQLARYSAFNDVVKRLRDNFPDYKFSSNQNSQVEALKLLAKLTGVANPPELLTSIASYFESVGDRGSLWLSLSSVISQKSTPTNTHKLLAAAARQHLQQKRAIDYLIVTTNYDCLMETALDKLDVPYAVLLTRNSDQKVVVRFSEKVDDWQWLNELNNGEMGGNDANGFVLQKGDLRNVVVIYKIHGCLYSKLKPQEADGVIISDNDYITYIKHMGKGSTIIPSHVNTIMNNKPFLFLGYSLNDWNIRSIFETMREKRSQYGGVQDFSVMYKVGNFEEVFFQRNDITIFQTDLNSYVDGVIKAIPEALGKDILW